MFKRLMTWIETAPRWLILLIFFSLLALYTPINHFSLFSPHKLPFLFGENLIPFIGWTSYIYLSLFIYVPLAIYLIPKERHNRTILALSIMCVTHFIIFIFFPTIYPRASINTGFIMFELLKIVDAPTNCFPSLHVAISMFLALALLRTRGDKLSVIIFFWAIIISLSTLTTKQHYVWDVLGSLVTSCLTSLLI